MSKTNNKGKRKGLIPFQRESEDAERLSKIEIPKTKNKGKRKGLIQSQRESEDAARLSEIEMPKTKNKGKRKGLIQSQRESEDAERLSGEFDVEHEGDEYVVEIENDVSWDWFVKYLKVDLGLGDGKEYTVISDKQKGLVKAVHTQLPKAEHRMCARHILRNWKRDSHDMQLERLL